MTARWARSTPIPRANASAVMESMILMGGYSLPAKTIREMITSSVDIIIQASRMRDGTRKITHVTEVIGIEGEVVTLQDLFVYDMHGEDASGRVSGRHRTTGIARPHFWDKARYFGEEKRLTEILSAGEQSRRAWPAVRRALCPVLSSCNSRPSRWPASPSAGSSMCWSCRSSAASARWRSASPTWRSARPRRARRAVQPTPADAQEAGAGHHQGHRGQAKSAKAGQSAHQADARGPQHQAAHLLSVERCWPA